MARVTRTDERMIIDANVAGYAKENVKIKTKIDDAKNISIVIDVKATSSDEKFGVYKDLSGFKDEIPVNKDIFDIDATKADIVDGILRISIPKKAEFVSKVLKDFAPSDPAPENT